MSDFSFYFTYVKLSKPNQSKLQGEDNNWPFFNTFLGPLKKLLNIEKVLSFPYNCCYYSASSTWNKTQFCLAANFYMNLKWHIVTVDVKVFQLFNCLRSTKLKRRVAYKYSKTCYPLDIKSKRTCRAYTWSWKLMKCKKKKKNSLPANNVE